MVPSPPRKHHWTLVLYVPAETVVWTNNTAALLRHRHQLIGDRDHVATADFYVRTQRIQRFAHPQLLLYKKGSRERPRKTRHVWGRTNDVI